MAGVAGPLRWAAAIVALDPVAGHEQRGTRRALVVSYEAFHRSGRMTICPIAAARSEARYPGDVALPAGQAGQSRAAVILCHQFRSISSERMVGDRVSAGAGVQFVTDPGIRAQVRAALTHHLGLDIPALADGAAARDG